MGRTVIAPPLISMSPEATTDTSHCPNPGSVTRVDIWNPPGYQGTTSEPFYFCFSSVNIRTRYYQGAGYPDEGTETTATKFEYLDTENLLTAVVDPVGDTWAFSYTSQQGGDVNYGEITSITTPQGGTLFYDWADPTGTATKGCNAAFFSAVTQRDLSPGGGSPDRIWTYSYSGNYMNPGAVLTATVTAQGDGSQIVHHLEGLSSTTSFYEYETDYLDSSGTTLRTDTTQFRSQPDFNVFNQLACQPALAMGVMPTSRTTKWANGATKSTTYQNDSGFQGTNYDGTQATIPYGLVITKTDSDYGAGGAGPALSTTTMDYLALDDPTSLANNLLDRISSIAVTDDKTGQESKTTYGYDESGLSGGSASGAGWTASPISTKRGNQTSVNRLWDTTGAFLATRKTYYNTGGLASVTEPPDSDISGSLTTIYAYNATYDGAYLTEVTDPAGHNTEYSYDFSSGRITSKTDANNQTSHYTYDQDLRLLTATHPSGDHNLSSSITWSYPSPTIEQKSEQLNTSLPPEEDTTTYNGLGEVIDQHHVDPDDGDVYVDTTYDGLGRVAGVTSPYDSKSDASAYATTNYTYDAIGRVIKTSDSYDGTYTVTQYAGATTLFTSQSNGNTTPQRMTKVDGLGRVIAVCELVTSATPAQDGGDVPGDCGMGIAGTGFLASYTQTTRGLAAVAQGTQPRSFIYDSLGQLTDSTNPESGHIHYVYDTDGNVVSKTMPAPNTLAGQASTVTINYQYNNIHQLLQKIYSGSGPSATTPADYYAYDQASVGGKTLENGAGRLTSEYTVLNGTVQTETVYSYDTEGRVGSHYQCVLSACGNSYQDVEYHYDGVGDVTQVATPNLGYTLNFDQAGHLTQIQPNWTADSEHPAVLATLHYAPNGGWRTAAFGNGTNETHAYTPRWLGGVQVAGVNQVSPATGSNGTIMVSGTEQVKMSQGKAASTAFTVTGSEGSDQECLPKEPGNRIVCTTYYDTGTVSVTVNGYVVSASYRQGATAVSVAAALVTGLNAAGSPVTATNSGAVVTMTSKNVGSSGNYGFSVTNAYDFQASPTSGSLSGGSNPSPIAYDAGSVTATINGATGRASYSQGATAGAIASSLAASLNSVSDGAFTATSSGTVVYVSSAQTGSFTNWPITVSVSYDTTHFGSPSFSAPPNGMSGGTDAEDANGTVYSVSLSHAPNGQIIQSTDSVNGSWSYVYDDFNRLISANSPGAGLTWDYDRYGNRMHQTLTAGTGTSDTVVQSYDAGGNALSDGLHAYAYDAENRIASVDGGVGYVYDAEGRRVGKTNGTVYIVGLEGNVLDEVDGGSWQRSEIVAAGRHIATVTPSGVYFVHADWSGTERARSDMTGKLCQQITSQPWGDDTQVSGTCSPSPNFLTGKPRDGESNLDDFGARYYASVEGRWMSPDWGASPTGTPYSTLANPQSLNLRAYVGNDPVDGIDPDGHMNWKAPDGMDDWFVDGDGECNCTEYPDQKYDSPSASAASQSPASAQQQAGKPAPTNPDGSPKSPMGDVPKLPDGKGPNGQLVPNDWKPGKGRESPDGRPTRWGPKYPIPGQSQPGVSWDPAGHWDYDPGVKGGGRTRWLPDGGGQVDHDGNPVSRVSISPATAGAAAKVGFWGAVGAITIRVIITAGEAAAAF